MKKQPTRDSVVAHEPRSARETSAPTSFNLPVERAFVVQLTAETSLTADLLTGRVEHVLSGQTARFHSLTELVTFFAQVLQPPSPLAARKSKRSVKP